MTASRTAARSPGSQGEHLLQSIFGTGERAERFYRDQVCDRLLPTMIEFVTRMEMMFVATADERGECDAVGQQLHPAPHVVVDLAEVTVLDPRGLAVLFTVHQGAAASGTEIHLVGAEHDVARRALRTTGLDQLLTLDPTADAVVAGFRAEPGRSAVLAAADPPRRRWIGRPVTAAGLATEDITGGAAAQPSA